MLQTNQQHLHNPMYVSINIPGNYLMSPRLKDTLIKITTLKIDKSFIDDVPLNEKDTLTLQSMLQLAESLNVEVVLEGVEAKTQLDFLIHACKAPIIQWYYDSKPLPIDEFLAWHEQFKGHLLIQPS